jgi:transcriptional regulator with XRE-family HTH domain|nr:MAG TPA: helix-turn-helix domain protein [Caudoviricetes sp.]
MKKQGEILKSLRLEKGLTQEELGKIINQSKQTVYNWENDKRKCDVESLFKLAKFFDVTIDYLTGYSNDRKPKTDLSDRQKKVINVTDKLSESEFNAMIEMIKQFKKET